MLLFGSAVASKSFWRKLYRNTLTTDFAQVLKNDYNNISDAAQRDRSIGYSDYIIP